MSLDEASDKAKTKKGRLRSKQAKATKAAKIRCLERWSGDSSSPTVVAKY